MFKTLNKGDKLYYARILPYVGTYEVCDMNIRTATDTYFVGVDKRDKRAYLFGYSSLGKEVFEDRKEALDAVHEAEKNKKIVSDETYYEEY